MWTKKYQPEKLEEVVGQKSVKDFEKWYKNWSPGDKMALLSGGPGVGKTAVVYALAKEKNLELIELNASDARNSQQIKEIIGESTKQQSLLQKDKLILIDEVDGISGRSDRGGVKELIKIIKESKFPVVFTANNAYDKKLRTLRNYCKIIKFGKVHLSSMTKRLKEICEEEGIDCDRKLVKKIGREAGGDMRSALNDLESIAAGKNKIQKEDLKSIDYREREKDIFEVLKVIFKTKNISNSISVIRDSEKDPEEIFWWIEENVTNEYKDKKEIAKAYDALSRADLFRKWIRIRQNWRLRKYMIDIMAGGVSLAKKKMYKKFTRYRPPKRFKMYGKSKGRRRKKEELCKKMGKKLHASSRRIMMDYFPYFKFIVKNKEWKENLKKEFHLDKKELKIITK